VPDGTGEEETKGGKPHNLFPALERKQQQQEPQVPQMVRPAADFVADEDFQEIVHCEQCDEPLIKMFSNDHKCD